MIVAWMLSNEVGTQDTLRLARVGVLGSQSSLVRLCAGLVPDTLMLDIKSLESDGDINELKEHGEEHGE